jgi:hypothetical protein
MHIGQVNIALSYMGQNVNPCYKSGEIGVCNELQLLGRYSIAAKCQPVAPRQLQQDRGHIFAEVAYKQHGVMDKIYPSNIRCTPIHTVRPVRENYPPLKPPPLVLKREGNF